jgi:hypothetical protein
MSELEQVLEKLEALGEGLAALQDAMGMLLEVWAPQAVTPPVPVKAPIASYEQMYGPMAPPTPLPPAPDPERPRLRGVRRWLVREET